MCAASCLHYQGDELYIEKVSLETIAERFGTPCYVYSRKTIEDNWHAFDDAFQFIPHRICYAVKANGNLTILNLLARLQSGFDIVSVGELERVLIAGGDPKKIIFSGVGKKEEEITYAIHKGIDCFDVESTDELDRIQKIAEKLNKIVNIALRVNPDVDPNTHAYISTGLKENKFGIELSEVLPLCKKISSMTALRLIGIACHIGSQITELEPFMLAMDCMLDLYQQIRSSGIPITHLNIGGGLGIIYQHEKPPSVLEYAKALEKKLISHDVKIIIEPGRAIVGNAGTLITQVQYLKQSNHVNFAIVDAGLNDLLRPALYDAWHHILPVTIRHETKKLYDIAGPVCESADFLGKNRDLALQLGDLLAIDSAGAYGFSMSSNYNARCRPAEVLVEGAEMKLIRRRETIQELFAAEI